MCLPTWVITSNTASHLTRAKPHVWTLLPICIPMHPTHAYVLRHEQNDSGCVRTPLASCPQKMTHKKCKDNIEHHRGSLWHDTIQSFPECECQRALREVAVTERHTGLLSPANTIIPAHVLIRATCDVSRQHDYATYCISTGRTSNLARATLHTACNGSTRTPVIV